MTTPKARRYTVADYMALPDDQRYELLDGELILAPSPTSRHQFIQMFLAATLFQFVEEHGLGRVVAAPLDVVLSDSNVAQPDLLFISHRRASIVTRPNIQGAPDLAVEILSPSTAGRDRGQKLDIYARYGVGEYWIVDPEAETVEIHVLRGDTLDLQAAYRRGQPLESPILPGLTIELTQIFDR